MMKSIGIFYILVCAMWIQAINPATASKYVSWKKGDHAVYADSSNNLITIELDNTSGKLVHYTNFAGLGPLWVQTSPDSEHVFIRITKRDKDNSSLTLINRKERLPISKSILVTEVLCRLYQKMRK